MDFDIEAIKAELDRLADETVKDQIEVAKRQAEIARKHSLMSRHEAILKSIEEIRALQEGRVHQGTPTESGGTANPHADAKTDGRSRRVRIAKLGSRDYQAIAREILRDSKGIWMSYQDVTKTASERDERFGGKDRRKQWKDFHDALKALCDAGEAEKQGTFFSLISE
jgi:hypothetical protein